MPARSSLPASPRATRHSLRDARKNGMRRSPRIAGERPAPLCSAPRTSRSVPHAMPRKLKFVVRAVPASPSKAHVAHRWSRVTMRGRTTRLISL